MFLAPAEAARKIGVREDALLAWESGATGPTLAQLRKAASTYRQPLAVFLLAEPPPESNAVVAFRTLPATDAAIPSPAFADALRRATKQQAVVRYLAELAGEDVPHIDFGKQFAQDAEASAAALRDWLGVPLGQQLSWKSADEAFRSWSQAVEDRDVLVIHMAGVSLSEARAFAEQSPPFPVIGLNGKDTAAGKIYSLLHELTHIILAANGRPTIHVFRLEAMSGNRDTSAESFCNQVTGAALMPAQDLLQQANALGTDPQSWSDDQLRVLSARYRVSREALLLRLVGLGRADQGLYRRKKRQFEAEYRLQAEAQRQDPGGGDYYRLKVRDLGRRFVADVLAAYDNEDISSRDVTRYLGVQLGQLPKLEHLVQRR